MQTPSHRLSSKDHDYTCTTDNALHRIQSTAYDNMYTSKVPVILMVAISTILGIGKRGDRKNMVLNIVQVLNLVYLHEIIIILHFGYIVV